MSVFENIYKSMAEHVSPISLFEMGQAGKLARQRAGGAIAHDWQAMRDFYGSKTGGGLAQGVSDYFSGHNIGMSRSWEGLKGPELEAYDQKRAMNSLYRKVAWGAVGGATVGATAMGSDSFVPSIARGGLKAAAVLGGSGALFHYANRLAPEAARSAQAMRIGGVGLLAYGAYRFLN